MSRPKAVTTQKETQFLNEIADGKTVENAAISIRIRPNTMKSHIEREKAKNSPFSQAYEAALEERGPATKRLYENRYKVYLVEHKDIELPFKYIGCTKLRMGRRIALLKAGMPKVIGKAIQDYGIDAFYVTVLVRNLTQEQGLEIENTLIHYYGTLAPNGYNQRSSGFNPSRKRGE